MNELSSSEMHELRELLEKEKIRKVKQLYSHLMDSNQIDALAIYLLKTPSASLDQNMELGRAERPLGQTIRACLRSLIVSTQCTM